MTLKHLVELHVHGVNLVFKVNSGASHSIISEDRRHNPPCGESHVAACGRGKSSKNRELPSPRCSTRLQPLAICNLLGRNWIEPLGISIHGQSDEARAPLPTWEHPSHPWQTLHLHFAGQLKRRMFLVIVDAYSKCLEMQCIPNAT